MLSIRASNLSLIQVLNFDQASEIPCFRPSIQAMAACFQTSGRSLIQAMIAFIGPLVDSGELRQDVPLPVLVRSFAGLFVFYVLSDAVAFEDDAPRFGFPLLSSSEYDWVEGMVDIYLNGARRRGDV